VKTATGRFSISILQDISFVQMKKIVLTATRLTSMGACTSLWRRDRDAKDAGVKGRGIGRVFPSIADWDLVQRRKLFT